MFAVAHSMGYVRLRCLRSYGGILDLRLSIILMFKNSKADAFERYLKSGSGRAFAKQHGHVEFSALTHFALQNKLPRHAFCQGQNACWRRGESKRSNGFLNRICKSRCYSANPYDCWISPVSLFNCNSLTYPCLVQSHVNMTSTKTCTMDIDFGHRTSTPESAKHD